MNLLIFILVCLSITNIIVRESILEFLRDFIDEVFPNSMLRKMIHCETCVGFHVGLVLAIIFPVFGFNWFIGACISSIANKIVNIILYKI